MTDQTLWAFSRKYNQQLLI